MEYITIYIDISNISFSYSISVLDDFEDAPNYYKRVTEEVKVTENLSNRICLEIGSILKCSSYQLTNFKPELLDLKFYKSYDSSDAPPYTEM